MLHRRLYRDHREMVMPPGLEPLYAYRDFDQVLRDDMDAMLRDPASQVLLAEQDEAPIGYITGRTRLESHRLLGRRGVLEDWYVEPEARGQGIGRALFEELLSRFRDAGVQVIESGTWPFNAGARAAHEALGFVETEIRYRRLLPDTEP